LQWVSGFLQVLRVFSTNKTDHCDITEILLKVALNTVTVTLIQQVNDSFLMQRELRTIIMLSVYYTNMYSFILNNSSQVDMSLNSDYPFGFTTTYAISSYHH
jgi:hypothetical protein